MVNGSASRRRGESDEVSMGKVTGFLEIDRVDRRYAAGVRPHPPLPRVHAAAERGGDARPGGALHELRHPLLPQRLPGQQPDSRLERPRLSRRMAGGVAQPAHAPTTSPSSPAASAPRRAKPPARSTSRTRRSPSRRSNAPSSTAPGQRAGSSRSRRRVEDRQARRRRRLGPRGPRLRPAARPRRPRGARLREERQARRPAALRHPRLQAREAARRPARRADGGGGRDVFHCGVTVGRDVSRRLAGRRLTTPSRWPAAPRRRATCRFPGRDLAGVHFAMEFLPQQNRRVAGEPVGSNEPILATGKHVVVIGGGDTGSDCIGTSIRQGALKVTQLEILPMPPKREDKLLTWPNWPLKLRTSSSHEEGAERDFAVTTTRVRRRERRGRPARMRARRRQAEAGSRHGVLAQGRSRAAGDGLRRAGAARACSTSSASRSTRAATSRPTSSVTPTSLPKVFACGDMRRGQSLVVWAIREGRQCAAAIDEALMGATVLPR